MFKDRNLLIWVAITVAAVAIFVAALSSANSSDNADAAPSDTTRTELDASETSAEENGGDVTLWQLNFRDRALNEEVAAWRNHIAGGYDTIAAGTWEQWSQQTADIANTLQDGSGVALMYQRSIEALDVDGDPEGTWTFLVGDVDRAALATSGVDVILIDVPDTFASSTPPQASVPQVPDLERPEPNTVPASTLPPAEVPVMPSLPTVAPLGN